MSSLDAALAGEPRRREDPRAWARLGVAALHVDAQGAVTATERCQGALGLSGPLRRDALEPLIRAWLDGAEAPGVPTARAFPLTARRASVPDGWLVALDEAPALDAALFHAQPEATLVVDEHCAAVLEANVAAERVLELGVGELRCTPPASLLDRLRRGAEQVLPWRGVDGATRLLELRVGDVATVGARRVRVATVRDVSSRLRAEAERTKSLEGMANARTFEALGLVAGIAHDLRNVLSIISAFAGGLHGELPAGEHKDDAQQIRTAARRAEGLVRRLVDFAKPSAKADEAYDAFDAVREAVALCQPALGPRFTVAVELPAGVRAPLVGDRGQLVLSLVNLLFNARDAMPGGGTISLSASCSGRRGVLRVADQGHGMPPDVLRRAFEPFFTTKPPGIGTGLGLSLVRSCVRAHGGDVRLQSEPAKGTTVTLWLPLDLPVEPPQPTLPAPEHPRGQALVIDDDDVMCLLLRTLLERQGFTVATTTRPDEAVALLQQLPQATLAVCDLVLPGMDGADVVRALKAQQPRLCVVVASGFADDRDVERVRALGAAAVLSKPFSTQEFDACVRRALERPDAPEPR